MSASILSVLFEGSTAIESTIKIPVARTINDKGKDVIKYASFRLPGAVRSMDQAIETLRTLSERFYGRKDDVIKVRVPNTEDANGMIFQIKPSYTYGGLADTLERLENTERETRKERAERLERVAAEEAARLEAERVAAEEAAKIADTNGTPVEGTVADATEPVKPTGRRNRKSEPSVS